jgi:uncharacterized membrane protein YhaH (DUF805 family)
VRWYIRTLKRYAVFSGRASRAEYWMFTLVNFMVMIGVAFIEAALRDLLGLDTDSSLVFYVYVLGVLLPTLGVSVRRLHDADRSGWWMLLGLGPVLGALALVVFFVMDGTPGPNRFGPEPKG